MAIKYFFGIDGVELLLNGKCSVVPGEQEPFVYFIMGSGNT